MKKILVTGANGQLGRCIKDASSKFGDFQFVYKSRSELDLEDTELIKDFFRSNQFYYCINTAAYTNVEKAESDSEKAFAINGEAVKNLAQNCNENNVVLMHISTDYVFDGKKSVPYTETDPTNPLNVYGASKLKGEEYISEICNQYFIFRTSWLYSQYGHNFFKTILKYAEEGKPLTITTEQIGAPTNANDLAILILNLIANGSDAYGIYHYSNKGEATWYDFAEEILLQTGKIKNTSLAKTNHYRTFAERPDYSVLDNSKIQEIISSPAVDWKESLRTIIRNSVNQ